MSSHDSREESCTDTNDESGRTCDSCGEPYSHEATAGPGRSKRSCGCDVVLNPVADDTPVGVANVAIRALNADGDVETAADVHEGARGRLVADGGTQMSRDRFECSECGFASGDREKFGGSGLAMKCPDCGSLRVEHVFTADEEETVTDGGVPETLEDLAGTCESCGDDVDPDRLIEGECPGCHYHEPVADGGMTWYDLHSFKRDLLRVAAEMEAEEARMAGLDIKDRLERRYNSEIHHGRLYPNLDDLVTAGLLEKGQIDRRTNSYEPTDTALAILRRQREAWDDLELPTVAVADGGEQA